MYFREMGSLSKIWTGPSVCLAQYQMAAQAANSSLPLTDSGTGFFTQTGKRELGADRQGKGTKKNFVQTQ